MLNKFYTWVGKNIMVLLLLLLFVSSLIAIINLVEIVRKPTPIKVIEGSVQHHLVWSIKGECFFVRPHTEQTVFLVRVADCDRK